MKHKPYKLNDGTWGAIGHGAPPIVGDLIEVETAAGDMYMRRVDRVVWVRDDRYAVACVVSRRLAHPAASVLDELIHPHLIDYARGGRYAEPESWWLPDVGDQ